MTKQAAAPLYEALKKYIAEGNIPFHVPGHKQGIGAPISLKEFLGAGTFCLDLTEVPGLDDLHHPSGPLKKAQELAAELFKADDSFLLVNGTTCGLQAGLMAACGPGDKVLVPRHAHRAVTGALVLSGAVPVYIKPMVDKEYVVPLGVRAEDMVKVIDAAGPVKAVMMVHPTYHGFVSDLPAITQICHSRGIPVLADEAHGAHFAFHGELPVTAMNAGVDVTVQSTHKTLGALTQGSMLHRKGRLISRENIARNLRVLLTTSPSYIVMASLDLARRQMAEEGRGLLADVFEMALWTRERIAGIKGIKCAGMDMTASCGIFGFDLTKILINVSRLGITGYEAAAVLRAEMHIQVEFADPVNILLVMSIGTTWDHCRELVVALEKLAGKYYPTATAGLARTIDLFDLPLPPLALTPREAWYAPASPVRIEAARDLVSAETVAPYPPGTPVICAGERITEEVVELLRYIRDNNIMCQGLADPGKNTIRTVNL